ncbi:MAG: hypothetical protein E4G99_06510, partial [Anaerolineales bacterium]
MMENNLRVIGKLGDTPVLVTGITWLPVTQLASFLGLLWYDQRRSPGRTNCEHVAFAGMTTAAILGSEWAHNLAHLTVAHQIGQPMDEMRIYAGMPRCIYYDLDDHAVTPRQHVIRAAAGPLFNASMLPLLTTLRQQSRPGSLVRELWDAAVGMNLFLATVSLLPIPGIDGGPLLKWTLVKQGRSPQAADRVVRQVNGPLAAILGLASALAYLGGKRLLALLLGLLSGTALGVSRGWIQETKILNPPN